MEKINNSIAFSLFFSLLMFVFLNYFFQTIFIFLNLNFPVFSFFAALVCSSTFGLINLNKSKKFRFLIFYFFIFCFSIAASILLMDTSYDGLWYQLDAVSKIKNDWNFIYELTYGEEMSEVYNTYTKAPWIIGANSYAVFGYIDAAKCFNWILLFSLACLSFFLFNSVLKYKKIYVFLFSFLVAFNPVTISQVFTYYIDGQLASLFSIMVLLMVLYIKIGNHKEIVIGIIASICLIANTKVTGLIYSGILSTGFIFCVFILKKEQFRFTFLMLSGAFGLAIFFFGFNPYVTNTIRHNHPFYPMNKPFIELHEPSNLVEMNNVQKAFYSYFSKSAYVSHEDSVKLKNPLDFSDHFYTIAEMITNGFGSFFSLILIVSLIILLVSIFYFSKVKWLLFLGCIIAFSALINPGVWWARYVPQLYLFPIILVIITLSITNSSIKKLGYLLLTLLCINSLNTMFNITFQTISKQISINNQLNKYENKIVCSSVGRFKVINLQLKERGILTNENCQLNENCERLKWGPDNTCISISEN